MKSGFALEHAAWPALIVSAPGVIIRANLIAIDLFGAGLDGDAPTLGGIWAPDNGTPPEVFLAQWEHAPAPIAAVKLKTKNGVKTFSVSICSFIKDEQKFFIVQLLPDTVPAGDGKDGNTEAGIALKQKLDCALQLARTVSLDFNNALTSILGHTSLMLSQIEPDHPLRKSLLEVEKSAGKAAEIASDLGTFSRQEKEARVQASGNLNSIMQRSVEVIQHSPTPKIQWTLQLERKLYSAKFDEAKMLQAFVKVLENSVQALPSSGRITVQTRNLELHEPSQDRDLRLAAGTYVCVEISDTGCGIPSEVLPRIFEPFFTTKKGGNHRGLGLAWVYGIVTNHGGGVAVSSQLGAGTSVRVYLPAEKKLVLDSAAATGDLKGNQTILMVDDEDLLLTMGQTVLSAFGYKVLTANSGQKALEMLSKNGAQIDLLITDLVMPAMSGRELIEHVKKVSPDTRILATSGFVRPAGQENDSLYLQKPFTSQSLLVKVKESLAAGA